MVFSLESTPSPTIQKLAFIGDTHIPYQDKGALAVALEFLKAFSPHSIFLMGDMMDCYDPSSFLKDPTKKGSLQREVDETIEFLTEVRQKHPDAHIYYLEGNHEVRLKRFLHKHEELHSLRCLRLEYLLNLEDLDISFSEYKDYLLYSDDLLIEHGFKTTKYAASNMIDIRGKSGITGHTHRLSCTRRTLTGRTLTWHENGHFQYTPVEYLHGEPNWQLGFTIGYDVHGDVSLYSIPIQINPENDYRYIVYGDAYFECPNINEMEE